MTDENTTAAPTTASQPETGMTLDEPEFGQLDSGALGLPTTPETKGNPNV